MQLKSPDSFIKTIGEFEVTKVPAGHFRKVRSQYLSNSDFNYNALAKTSVVAGQLFDWLKSTLAKEELHRAVPDEPELKQPTPLAFETPETKPSDKTRKTRKDRIELKSQSSVCSKRDFDILNDPDFPEDAIDSAVIVETVEINGAA